MGALVLAAAVFLGVRGWLARMPAPEPDVVVEVRGDVPGPGFHPLSPPPRVHDALRAAGVEDPSAFADGALDPGTRIVVLGPGRLRTERMDDLAVFGIPIDVNEASAEALEAIPGLGPSKAAAIVADRESRGDYASIDDLVRVRGIGPATVEIMRPFVVTKTHPRIDP